MIELDSKLLDQFKGYVVRKDVVRSVKGGANVPVFVLEYLLANSCSTDDEEKIQEGIDNVKRVLHDHYVNPDEAILVQAKIREQGTYKIIDKISVRLELQADFYAGIWAYHDNVMFGSLQDGDIEEGLNVASKIGDDYLQKKAQGYEVPDSFNHGRSEQRVKWLKKGLTTGDIKNGDTFSPAYSQL